MKDLLIGLALMSCPAMVFVIFGTSGLEAFEDGTPSRVSTMPSEDARLAFSGACAGCHGRLAEGTARGPSLIDPAYASPRFDDAAFRRAVRQGVPAGARGFGAMPAFPDLPEPGLDRALSFVREIQRANDIR